MTPGSGVGSALSPAGQPFAPVQFFDVVATDLELVVVERTGLAEPPRGGLAVEHPVFGIFAEQVLLEVNRMGLHACPSAAM